MHLNMYLQILTIDIKIMKAIYFLLISFICSNISLNSQETNEKVINEYVNVLKTQGSEPVTFVNNKLDQYDLLIFDDALHLALEPFKFYEELIKNTVFNSRVKYIFIEVFSIYSQPLIDKYLASPVKDSSILFNVFQDDFAGNGLRYKTYFDLFSTVWEMNKGFTDKDKIKIISVDMPIIWSSINSSKDYELFQKTLDVRDYFMYKQILNSMNGFNSGYKGIFLTNTRHAYRNIRNSKGELYWNCNTFFNQMNPGKTFSIRFHNVTLAFTPKEVSSSDHKTIEGLQEYDYHWVRMEGGIWDKAFKENGNIHVAIPLDDNLFGGAKYIGNHMMDVLGEETMYDAYDALIFLAPLENLNFTAMVDWIYTEDFKKEVARRITAINDGDINDVLKNSGASDLKEYIESIAKYVPEQKNYFVKPDDPEK